MPGGQSRGGGGPMVCSCRVGASDSVEMDYRARITATINNTCSTGGQDYRTVLNFAHAGTPGTTMPL